MASVAAASPVFGGNLASTGPSLGRAREGVKTSTQSSRRRPDDLVSANETGLLRRLSFVRAWRRARSCREYAERTLPMQVLATVSSVGRRRAYRVVDNIGTRSRDNARWTASAGLRCRDTSSSGASRSFSYWWVAAVAWQMAGGSARFAPVHRQDFSAGTSRMRRCTRRQGPHAGGARAQWGKRDLLSSISRWTSISGFSRKSILYARTL